MLSKDFCLRELNPKAQPEITSENTSGLAAVSETILVINYAYADEVLWNWAPKL